MNGRSALQLVDIKASYGNGLVLRGVTFALAAGEMAAIIGPNGSGKTTLLRVASGVLRPREGYVELHGHALGTLGRREVARQMAVVPQELYVPFALTAAEIVLMGRTPHGGGSTAEDRCKVAAAMDATGTRALAERVFNELSGGERQRVLIAMALAQEPRLLLLDEPTVHLDISHQMEVLELVRRLNRERGLTVLATMHDLNLAALYFERLLLLEGGRASVDGPPAMVLSEEHVRRAFGASVQVQPHPTAAAPQIVVIPRPPASA